MTKVGYDIPKFYELKVSQFILCKRKYCALLQNFFQPTSQDPLSNKLHSNLLIANSSHSILSQHTLDYYQRHIMLGDAASSRHASGFTLTILGCGESFHTANLQTN
jgi:hypothetical protein